MTDLLIYKLKTAVEAAKAIHEDTSGPASDNMEAIETLIGEIEVLRDLLRYDCGQ